MNASKRIQTWLTRDFRIGDLEKDMLERGFIGNGCGCDGFSHLITLVVMYIFRIRLKVSCWIHDAGYSVSRSEKSDDHKNRVDTDFQHNMIVEMTEQGVKAKLAKWIAVRFHAAVLIKGGSAYWKE